MSTRKSKSKSKAARARSIASIPSSEEPCGIAYDPPKPRRSMPIHEVEELVHREISRVKSEATIYDQRSKILRDIQSVNDDLEHFEHTIHRSTLRLKELQAELNRVNLAIARRLELDSE